MPESQDRLPVAGSSVDHEQSVKQEIQDFAAEGGADLNPENGKGTNRQRIIGAAIIGTIVVAIMALSIYGMVTHPVVTSVVRDISIIVLALVTLTIGIFLIVLIFQLQSLIALLRDEIKPILESANETANTVRGTTTFVSDAVVSPMIQVASLASGVAQTLRTLARTGHKADRRTRKTPGSTGD